MKSLPLTDVLRQFIAEIPDIKRIWVAFSGGCDSTVLLHAVCSLNLPIPIAAIHINHNLSVNADRWSQHCQRTASEWNVDEFLAKAVNVEKRGEGIEQAARKARYTVFHDELQTGDLLLLGHHQQDQVETFLLRLARGAGANGLSSMRSMRPFAKGLLGRPFLFVPKECIYAYAQKHHLNWIEDESNLSTDYDRNYLRLNVLPHLLNRWPAFNNQAAKATQVLADEFALLQSYLKDDFKKLKARKERVGHSIEIQYLMDLELPKLFALIRYWLNELGYPMVAMEQMHQVVNLLSAAEDAKPLIAWQFCELRRFQQRLYCLPNNWQETMLTEPGLLSHHLSKAFTRSAVEQNDSLGNKKFIAKNDDELTKIGMLNGVKRGHPSQRNHSQTLKKLFQEFRVEPWLRPHWPVVMREQKIVCLPGLWVEKRFCSEQGVWLDWQSEGSFRLVKEEASS